MNDFQKTFPKIKSNEVIPQNYKIKGCSGRFITYATYPINTFNNRDKTNLNLKNITGWIGAWAECDLFTIDEQFNFIKELDIEPTYIVFSGNKSLHPAFIYDKKLTNRKIQENIIKGMCVLLHGDPACKNLDRSVRQPDYSGDDRQQPILKFSGLTYNAQDLLNNIENKVFERYNLKIDEAFARVEFYKKDKIKIVELPPIPQKSFSVKNYTWTTDLDDIYLTDKMVEITVKEFIESNIKNQSLICRNPEHMEKNHSAFMIRNEKSVVVGCHGCGFRKTYKIKTVEKDYSDVFDIITINEKYIPTDLLLKYDNIILKSGTGTGKTTAVAKSGIIKSGNSVAISHLINLSKNMSSVLETKFYQDQKGNIDLDLCGNVSICINSLLRVKGNIDNIFVDEIMQVLKAIVGGTVEEKENIAVRLQEIIINAKKVILADAHSSLAELYELLRPTGKRFVVIDNKYKSNKSRFLYSEETNFYKVLDSKLNEKCFVYCASKAESNTVEKYILDKNSKLKILKINSDTTLHFSKYFEKPNLIFEEYDILIASPSVGSGVSITTENINIFCIAESGEHVSAHSLWQGMERVRQPKSTHIYIGHKNLNLPDDADAIYNYELNSQIKNDSYCMTIINKKRDFANKDLIKLFSAIQAKDNFYKNNIKEEFKSLLLDDGEILKSEVISSGKDIKEFKSKKYQAKKDVKIAYVKDIINSNDLTETEYVALNEDSKKGIPVSLDDQKAMKKFRFQKYFDNLNEELIYDLEFNGLLKKVFNFSNYVCFTKNEDFRNKLIEKDFAQDKESKWGNEKNPLFYKELQALISTATCSGNIDLSTYIQEGVEVNKINDLQDFDVSEFEFLGFDGTQRSLGLILDRIGIKTIRVRGTSNKSTYYIDSKSVKFMFDISNKIIERNLNNTIDADLKQIFKKYEDNL